MCNCQAHRVNVCVDTATEGQKLLAWRTMLNQLATDVLNRVACAATVVEWFATNATNGSAESTDSVISVNAAEYSAYCRQCIPLLTSRVQKYNYYMYNAASCRDASVYIRQGDPAQKLIVAVWTNTEFLIANLVQLTTNLAPLVRIRHHPDQQVVAPAEINRMLLRVLESCYYVKSLAATYYKNMSKIGRYTNEQDGRYIYYYNMVANTLQNHIYCPLATRINKRKKPTNMKVPVAKRPRTDDYAAHVYVPAPFTVTDAPAERHRMATRSVTTDSRPIASRTRSTGCSIVWSR
jgi:hypothetical protein